MGSCFFESPNSPGTFNQISTKTQFPNRMPTQQKGNLGEQKANTRSGLPNNFRNDTLTFDL